MMQVVNIDVTRQHHMHSPSRFTERLLDPRPILLDGATGTELSRRGVDLNVPSWTAGVILEHPQTLWQIHRDYADAGAEMVTANTFRTHARNLRHLGLEHQAGKLTMAAVQIARDAVGSGLFVAGSMAPLEDCYSPQLTPSPDELAREHLRMAQALAEAGVDFILIETQVTVREAVTAARAAGATGIPFGVSFVCNREGRLLSGEALTAAYAALAPLRPALFLANCAPVDEVLPALAPLVAENGPMPLGAYANTGRLLPNGSWEGTDGNLPAVYAEYARSWMQAGFRLIGGCCGTTPDHISAIHNALYSEHRPSKENS